MSEQFIVLQQQREGSVSTQVHVFLLHFLFTHSFVPQMFAPLKSLVKCKETQPSFVQSLPRHNDVSYSYEFSPPLHLCATE